MATPSALIAVFELTVKKHLASAADTVIYM